MLVKKSLRNGKTSVTSSYFDDMRLVKQSLYESKKDDYVSAKWRREKGRDFRELELQTAIMAITLAKKGAAEVSEFADSLKPAQYEQYVLNYGPWKDYESYDSLEKTRDELLEKKKHAALDEEDEKELDRVTAEIKDIDSFVKQELERDKTASEEVFV